MTREEGGGPCYYYLGTVEGASAVSHSAYANFVGCREHNLVVAKGSRLHIYAVEEGGLLHLMEVPISGRITALIVLPGVAGAEVQPAHPAPAREGAASRQGQGDTLLVLVEKERYFAVSYDREQGAVHVGASGDLHDRACRPTEGGQLVALDPGLRFVAIHSVQGIIKVIPIDGRAKEYHFREALNRRIEELAIIDMAFVASPAAGGHAVASSAASGSRSLSSNPFAGRIDSPMAAAKVSRTAAREGEAPTLVVLHECVSGGKALKTYRIGPRDLEPGPWAFDDLEGDSHTLIAVPSPRGGILVIADQSIFYYNHARRRQCAIAIRPVHLVCHCRIDDDGFRYLFGDAEGSLYLLILQAEPHQPAGDGPAEGAAVTGLNFELLGRTTIASTITYLDRGFVYIGSSLGDSQVVSLSASPLPSNGQFVRLVDTFNSLAPILDFVPVDLEMIGQQSLVLSTGAYKECSALRVVRKGTNIHTDALVDLGSEAVGISRLFSLDCTQPATGGEAYGEGGSAAYIFASTADETRIFRLGPSMQEGGAVEEVMQAGFIDGAQASLYVGRLAGCILHVTPRHIIIGADFGSTAALPTIWRPPGRAEIVHAAPSLSMARGAPCGTHLAVATSDGRIVLLEVDAGACSVVERGSYALSQEASTLALYETASGQRVICVALWPAPAGPAVAGKDPDRPEWLPSLVAISCQSGTISQIKTGLDQPTIIRSLAVHAFAEGDASCAASFTLPHLFVGTGGGLLLHAPLCHDDDSGLVQTEGALVSVILGTGPIKLSVLPGGRGGGPLLVAHADRPFILSRVRSRIFCSMTNAKNVHAICASLSNKHLVMARDSDLAICTVQAQVRRLHQQSHPLHSTATRLYHHGAARAFVLLLTDHRPPQAFVAHEDGDAPAVASRVSLVDQDLFAMIDAFSLGEGEVAHSIDGGFVSLLNCAVIVVGTAIASSRAGEEPAAGRLLTFMTNGDRRLVLLCETPTLGCAYGVALTCGSEAHHEHVVATINGMVWRAHESPLQVLALAMDDSNAMRGVVSRRACTSGRALKRMAP